MDTNMQCKKARMDEGIIPIKPLPARWRRETFQTQHPMWKNKKIKKTIKMKNNICNGMPV